jgi:hypothetical protein
MSFTAIASGTWEHQATNEDDHRLSETGNDVTVHTHSSTVATENNYIIGHTPIRNVTYPQPSTITAVSHHQTSQQVKESQNWTEVNNETRQSLRFCKLVFAIDNSPSVFEFGMPPQPKDIRIRKEIQALREIIATLSKASIGSSYVIPWSGYICDKFPLKELRIPKVGNDTDPCCLLQTQKSLEEIKDSEVFFLMTDGEITEPRVNKFAKLIPHHKLHSKPCVCIIYNNRPAHPKEVDISVGVALYARSPDGIFLFHDVNAATNTLFVLQSKGCFGELDHYKKPIDGKTKWNDLPTVTYAALRTVFIPQEDHELLPTEILLQNHRKVRIDQLFSNRLDVTTVEALFANPQDLHTILLIAATQGNLDVAKPLINNQRRTERAQIAARFDSVQRPDNGDVGRIIAALIDHSQRYNADQRERLVKALQKAHQQNWEKLSRALAQTQAKQEKKYDDALVMVEAIEKFGVKSPMVLSPVTDSAVVQKSAVDHKNQQIPHARTVGLYVPGYRRPSGNASEFQCICSICQQKSKNVMILLKQLDSYTHGDIQSMIPRPYTIGSSIADDIFYPDITCDSCAYGITALARQETPIVAPVPVFCDLLQENNRKTLLEYLRQCFTSSCQEDTIIKVIFAATMKNIADSTKSTMAQTALKALRGQLVQLLTERNRKGQVENILQTANRLVTSLAFWLRSFRQNLQERRSSRGVQVPSQDQKEDVVEFFAYPLDAFLMLLCLSSEPRDDAFRLTALFFRLVLRLIERATESIHFTTTFKDAYARMWPHVWLTENATRIQYEFSDLVTDGLLSRGDIEVLGSRLHACMTNLTRDFMPAIFCILHKLKQENSLNHERPLLLFDSWSQDRRLFEVCHSPWDSPLVTNYLIGTGHPKYGTAVKDVTRYPTSMPSSPPSVADLLEKNATLESAATTTMRDFQITQVSGYKQAAQSTKQFKPSSSQDQFSSDPRSANLTTTASHSPAITNPRKTSSLQSKTNNRQDGIENFASPVSTSSSASSVGQTDFKLASQDFSRAKENLEHHCSGVKDRQAHIPHKGRSVPSVLQPQAILDSQEIVGKPVNGPESPRDVSSLSQSTRSSEVRVAAGVGSNSKHSQEDQTQGTDDTGQKDYMSWSNYHKDSDSSTRNGKTARIPRDDKSYPPIEDDEDMTDTISQVKKIPVNRPSIPGDCSSRTPRTVTAPSDEAMWQHSLGQGGNDLHSHPNSSNVPITYSSGSKTRTTSESTQGSTKVATALTSLRPENETATSSKSFNINNIPKGYVSRGGTEAPASYNKPVWNDDDARLSNGPQGRPQYLPSGGLRSSSNRDVSDPSQYQPNAGTQTPNLPPETKSWSSQSPTYTSHLSPTFSSHDNATTYTQHNLRDESETDVREGGHAVSTTQRDVPYRRGGRSDSEPDHSPLSTRSNPLRDIYEHDVGESYYALPYSQNDSPRGQKYNHDKESDYNPPNSQNHASRGGGRPSREINSSAGQSNYGELPTQTNARQQRYSTLNASTPSSATLNPVIKTAAMSHQERGISNQPDSSGYPLNAPTHLPVETQRVAVVQQPDKSRADSSSQPNPSPKRQAAGVRQPTTTASTNRRHCESTSEDRPQSGTRGAHPNSSSSVGNSNHYPAGSRGAQPRTTGGRKDTSGDDGEVHRKNSEYGTRRKK